MSVGTTTGATDGPPTGDDFSDKIEVKPGDSKDTEATKIKYQATYQNQFLQGCLNSCRVIQDGAKSVGVAT
jgi:hypothetical protein